MENTTPKTNPYQGLFNQTSEEARRILNPDRVLFEPDFIGKKEKLPSLQQGQPANDNDRNVFWVKLRAFFSGEGPVQGASIEGLLPATFAPFIGKQQVEEVYPIFVSETEHANLEKLLTDRSKLQSDNSHFHLLEKFLPQLVQNIRNQVGNEEVVSFEDALSAGFQNFRNEVELGKEDRRYLMVLLGELERNLPKDGALVPFGIRTPYYLLSAALEYNREPKLELIEKLNLLFKTITGLFENEKLARDNKTPHSDDSLGFAGTMVDLDALASVSPSASTEPLSENRFKRFEQILADLKVAEQALSKNGWMIIEAGFANRIGKNLVSIFENSDIATVETGKVCEATLKLFNTNMKAVSNAIAAIRKAELEIKGNYDAAFHDSYFENFDWRQFTNEELSACPITMAVVDDAELIKEELGGFSDLLARDLPIRLLAIRTEDLELSDTAELRIRQELASIAIAHRNTYVYQSVLVDPDRSLNGIYNGLRLTSPSVFHFLLPNEDNNVNPLLWSSAAIESRAFPTLNYSGMSESSWGSRWNIDHNPQIQNNWTEHEVTLKDNEVLNIVFTYADFMSLEKDCYTEFAKVDAQFWTNDLVPLSDYLTSSSEEQIGKVPFIWMIDEELTIYRVAVSWKATMASLERLDHWRYLQENSGVHNYHAEHALEEREADLSIEARQEIDKLKTEHEKELQKVRDESTDKAMEHLTSVLLDLDPASFVPSSTVQPKVTTAAKTEAPVESKTEKSAVQKEEIDDDLGSIEAWIDTPLCTTCDECTGINDKVFMYNGDKKAYIKDAKAGTFADLVKAAESCTVSIIHPGTPLNPNEPGLDDLIARAAKFN
ncbi:hypothetical protein ACFLR1_00600 [Bacteroidota bacterium]